MGNAFYGDATPASSSSSSSLVDSYDESLFSKSEGETLVRYYKEVYDTKSKRLNREKLRQDLPFSRIPGLTEIIIADNKLEISLSHLSSFVGNCLRFSSTLGVDILWRSLSKLPTVAVPVPSPTPDGGGEAVGVVEESATKPTQIQTQRSILFSFFYLSCDLLLSGQCSDADCDKFASRMVDIVSTNYKKQVGTAQPPPPPPPNGAAEPSNSKSSTASINNSSNGSNSSSLNASDLEHLKSWISDFCPLMTKGLEDAISNCFFDRLSFSPYLKPTLKTPSAAMSDLDLLPLSLFNRKIQGEMTRLYDSESDGKSFNRLCYALLGFDGPTLIVIRRGDVVFGGYSDDKWKDSNRHFGSSNDFLFTLNPKTRVYRCSNSSNRLFRWLNTKSYGLPHGLGFGGTDNHEKFRFFISDKFDDVVTFPSCLTFEPGKLIYDNMDISSNSNNNSKTLTSSNAYSSTASSSSAAGGGYSNSSSSYGGYSSASQFGISRIPLDVIEVWGVGGPDGLARSLAAREEMRATKTANIERARKVDKAAFFSNGFDQEFLLSKTLAHRTEQDSREAPRLGGENYPEHPDEYAHHQVVDLDLHNMDCFGASTVYINRR